MAMGRTVEEDLRAWADAFNAVADLQHEIVEIAEDLTPMTESWLNPFRDTVFAAFHTPVTRTYNNAGALQHVADEALKQLREEAKGRMVHGSTEGQ
jgi:hypothetical protein